MNLLLARRKCKHLQCKTPCGLQTLRSLGLSIAVGRFCLLDTIPLYFGCASIVLGFVDLLLCPSLEALEQAELHRLFRLRLVAFAKWYRHAVLIGHHLRIRRAGHLGIEGHLVLSEPQDVLLRRYPKKDWQPSMSRRELIVKLTSIVPFVTSLITVTSRV